MRNNLHIGIKARLVCSLLLFGPLTLEMKAFICVDRHGAVSTLLLPLVLEYELASGHARLSSISILVRTLLSSLVSKKEKLRLFTRNKETNKLELMWCTPFALASKPSRPTTGSSNIDTSKLKTKVSVLTGENKTLCHDLHGRDNLLFDSYATVSKLEQQLDTMIRTPSNQEETLLQMEEDINQKKRDLKQVLAHYKPSNVDRRDAAHKVRKREHLDENIQLSRKVQQIQTELQSKQIMFDESNLSVHKLQRSRRSFNNILKKLQTTEIIVDKMSNIKSGYKVRSRNFDKSLTR